MASSAQLVKQLRDQTGAGVMDCKEALQASSGDLQAAVEYLRKKGLAQAAKRSHRDAREGAVGTYIHPGAKLGVLIEVNCETDFVARTEAFQGLVKDLGMQVAAANPDQKKPAQVLDKIIEGKLEKFYTEQCLLEQPFIKDASGKTKVREIVDGVNAKTGEHIIVKRFARFQVGEAG
jgi:elongation factor Ts